MSLEMHTPMGHTPHEPLVGKNQLALGFAPLLQSAEQFVCAGMARGYRPLLNCNGPTLSSFQFYLKILHPSVRQDFVAQLSFVLLSQVDFVRVSVRGGLVAYEDSNQKQYSSGCMSLFGALTLRQGCTL